MKKQLEALIEEIKATDNSEGAFDGLVHDLKSEEASAINNKGIESQVRYIVEYFGIEEAIKKIKEELLII